MTRVPIRRSRWAFALMGTLSVLTFLRATQPVPTGRVVVTYWEKWVGIEAAGMREVVDAFNASQDRIWVDFITMSQIDRKLIVATAGGHPPDVAGIWFAQYASFADRAALTDLSGYIRRDWQREPAAWLNETYSTAYASMPLYRGSVRGLISAGSTVAMYWNKTLFREAGLDPEHPPRTLAELEDYSQKLTRRDGAGRLLATGFVPNEPDWFTYSYPAWFGGQLVTEDGRIDLSHDARALAALQWEREYTQCLGLAEAKRFTSGFGGFGSAQQAFYTGKVAMVFQGSWYDRFLRQYAPSLDYGVAAWPEADGETGPANRAFTIADVDLLVIPRGAAHPEEAWEFIRYATEANLAATQQSELRGVERIAFVHEKPSPLKQWSPWLTAHHPNPSIGLYRELGDSSRAWHAPMVGVWTEYLREIKTAQQKVRLLVETPGDAAAYLDQRIGGSLDRHNRSVERQKEFAVTAEGATP